MPIRFNFNPDTGLIHGEFSGVVTAHEFEEMLRELCEADSFPPDCDAVWDCRDIDFRATDREFLNTLIGIRADFPQRGGARLAMIASQDLGFGLTRMFEALSEHLPQTLRVFRTKEDAEQWLLRNTERGA